MKLLLILGLCLSANGAEGKKIRYDLDPEAYVVFDGTEYRITKPNLLTYRGGTDGCSIAIPTRALSRIGHAYSDRPRINLHTEWLASDTRALADYLIQRIAAGCSAEVAEVNHGIVTVIASCPAEEERPK